MNDRRAFLARATGAAALALLGPRRAFAARAKRASGGDDLDRPLAGDRYVDARQRRLLVDTLSRMRRVQATVGYGNFALLGFDQMRKVARQYHAVEAFTRAEAEFIEGLFYFDAREYGFYGEKVLGGLTDQVEVRHAVVVRGTGQRLLRGMAIERYQEMRRAVGPALVLTSGMRSMSKQIYLFLAKAARVDGNLSRASRSLAPPGYSFHAVGDFDVGQQGLGAANFTAAFARSEVFKRLVATDNLRMRYPRGNYLGVRYEPWHIRVV